MKSVLVTQRVDNTNAYCENRDSLDQRWLDFLLASGLLPIIVPNNITYVTQLIATTTFAGVIFTGGNSLVCYGGSSPERDQVENLILDHAFTKGIPVLGICRGMQLIQHFFGVSLQRIVGHAASTHALVLSEKGRLSHYLANIGEVNSYHDYGSSQSCDNLLVLAHAPDNIIEAIEHVIHPIFGIMWHPERQQQFRQIDLEIFKYVFGS